MATKTITITADAYTLLARAKSVDESFSEGILRILSKKGSIMDFAGVWSSMSEAEATKLKGFILKMRKSSKPRI